MVRRVLLVSCLVALAAIASGVSLKKHVLQPDALIDTSAATEAPMEITVPTVQITAAPEDPANADAAAAADAGADEPKEEGFQGAMTNENSHEPLYKELTTAQKEAAVAKHEPGPPVTLPFGTKISVPGLPPGSRVNPGGITPLQRAFDKKISFETEEEDVDEDAELSAERTLKEDPHAHVKLHPPPHHHHEGKDCIDCNDALSKIDDIAAKMEDTMGELAHPDSAPAADEGYGDAAADVDEGYGADAASTAASTVNEGYDDAADAEANGGYTDEAAAAPADEGYGADSTVASTDGYAAGETEVAEGADGYAATTDETAAEAAVEGDAAAGDVPLETEFLEISNMYTPESLLKRIGGVDAPIPGLLKK